MAIHTVYLRPRILAVSACAASNHARDRSGSRFPRRIDPTDGRARFLVALDLETTGLYTSRDTIIEIGAVRFQGYCVLDRFVTLVNPQRSIPLRITQITGIRNADVAGAPVLAAVLPELLAFVASDVAAIVAHNAGFDLGFLRAAGVQFHRPVYDTFEKDAYFIHLLFS